MTNADRRAARHEVEAARAELIRHLAELEEAANLPKRLSRRVGVLVHRGREWAAEQPAAAAGAAAAAVAVVAGVVTVIVRATRR